MLSQPQETLELQNKQSKQLAVTQLAFPKGDVNNFIIGSEDGVIYSGKLIRDYFTNYLISPVSSAT